MGMQQTDADIVVVGAGPAGMMAAIGAAERGRRVLLLDRMPKPGLKLLATGGGRCNLTNVLPADQFMGRCGRFGRFMEPALRGLDNEALLKFFATLGVKSHCTDGFHYFPVAESAAAVQETLFLYCGKLGVKSRCNCRVTRVTVSRPGVPLPGQAAPGEGQERGTSGLASEQYPARGCATRSSSGTSEAGSPGTARPGHGTPGPLIVETDQGTISAGRVILAAGGRSYAGLGADGSGFGLAAHLGHTVKPALPALVPLVARETWVAECAGTTFADAEVWIDLPKRRGVRMHGPVLFTHRGLSGPAVLDLSGEVAALLEKMPEVPLRVRWQRAESAAEWARRLDGWRREHGGRLVRNLLDEKLPASFATALAAACGAAETKAANLTAAQAARLVEHLTELPLHVTATEGFGKAMVTRGGVALQEIHPETLESRRVPGLYFAGEIVDLDGPCGGYNLQWAFSSGRLAGRSAAAAAPA